MLKVMTVVGTRPEIIKMSRVINIFNKYTKHILVHTGQNYDYELNEVFFNDLNIKDPDYFLSAQAENPAHTIANVIAKTDDLLAKIKPDVFMVYGDTNSCLSVIAAKRRKIPIFHMEAGNRCFDQRVPEEINRKIVDHTSDVNMVLSEHARHYLLNEGFPADRIIKTGSHMKEVINFYKEKIENSNILTKLNLLPKSYFVLSLHREENIEEIDNIKILDDLLNTIVNTFDKKIIVSLHPRTRNKLKNISQNFEQRIEFHKPFAFSEYIKLQQNAFCVLSDSGTISEEASILNFPAVILRNTHERPESMDSGVAVMSKIATKNILTAIRVSLLQDNREVLDYQQLNVSQKVLQTVLSYFDFVNKVVWSK